MKKVKTKFAYVQAQRKFAFALFRMAHCQRANSSLSGSCLERKIAKCCKEKSLLHCTLCKEFPCGKIMKIGDFSDLNTNGHYSKTCYCISKNGFDFWYQEYVERKTLLTTALEKYNNGRMKRYLCELFMREELIVLREIMEKAKELTGTQKEVSLGFKHIVENIY